ncbi:PaaI family thioesterase [Pseudonocardia sp. ICBG1293]|uniref:PaaI family thioesterase n=1 Tax=Pseudonocardia sp. ICBG1293 TaxID=2844382 RepID=UPI001CCFC8AD|nr:acyl-CoA thioesterase domain-containing protein [Pseudonocardia sp. ICBG1293]
MTGTTPPQQTRPGPGTRERMRRAPVETGLGMVPDPSSTRERIVLRAPLHDGVRTADGGVLPVLPALLADSGLGYLVFSTARLTAGAPTVDLRLDQAGAPAAHARWLRAELTLLHLDDEVAVGRADMHDDTGAAVAHVVATFALLGAPARPGGLATGAGAPAPAPGTPTPGTPTPDTDLRAGLPPFDPARLRPEHLERDADGDVVFLPGPSTTNLNGTTHGSVLSGLAAAAQAAHPGAEGARPLSVTVEFLRPVQVTDRLRARTVAIRDGRRFRTLGTELLLPDGRAAVRAVGTALRR